MTGYLGTRLVVRYEEVRKETTWDFCLGHHMHCKARCILIHCNSKRIFVNLNTMITLRNLDNASLAIQIHILARRVMA